MIRNTNNLTLLGRKLNLSKILSAVLEREMIREQAGNHVNRQHVASPNRGLERVEQHAHHALVAFFANGSTWGMIGYVLAFYMTTMEGCAWLDDRWFLQAAGPSLCAVGTGAYSALHVIVFGIGLRFALMLYAMRRAAASIAFVWCLTLGVVLVLLRYLALAMTETELRLIAAAAITGLRSRPKKG